MWYDECKYGLHLVAAERNAEKNQQDKKYYILDCLPRDMVIKRNRIDKDV